jgi:hypothetical protein
MCTCTDNNKQIPPTIQRYIPIIVQRNDSSSSEDGVMGGSLAWILLSVYSELLLDVRDEDGGTTCSARNGTDGRDAIAARWPRLAVTPDFPKKTKCISYVRQDQVYMHMIDVMSEISINSNKNVQELNHYVISLLHSDDRLEGLYNDQTITKKTQLHLHLPQASDWGHASLRTPRSRWSTLLQCSPLNSG